MIKDRERRKAATHEAMTDPKIGDRFTELFAFWVFVIGRVGNKVVTLEANAPCTLPDDGNLKTYESVDDFRERFAYGSIPGYWVDLVDRGNDYTGWAS